MKENLEKSSAIPPTTEAVGFLAGWNREDVVLKGSDDYIDKVTDILNGNYTNITEAKQINGLEYEDVLNKKQQSDG